MVDKTEQVLLSSGEEESMAFWNLVVGQKEDKEILENAERMKEISATTRAAFSVSFCPAIRGITWLTSLWKEEDGQL